MEIYGVPGHDCDSLINLLIFRRLQELHGDRAGSAYIDSVTYDGGCSSQVRLSVHYTISSYDGKGKMYEDPRWTQIALISTGSTHTKWNDR